MQRKTIDQAAEILTDVLVRGLSFRAAGARHGIGKSTATRIVEYRQKNGPFKKIEELMNVQGIGEKSFLKLRAQLTVGATAPASQQ